MLVHTGTVPLPACCPPYHPSLRRYSYSYNRLYGPLDTALAPAGPQVTHLLLAGNFLRGPLPPVNATSLQLLDVSNNRLTGQLPSSFVTAPAAAVNLARNPGLCGAVPAWAKPLATAGTQLGAPCIDATQSHVSMALPEAPVRRGGLVAVTFLSMYKPLGSYNLSVADSTGERRLAVDLGAGVVQGNGSYLARATLDPKLLP